MVTLSPADLEMLQQFQNAQPSQGNAVPAPTPEDFATLQPQALYQQPTIDPRTQQMDQAMLDKVSTPPAATQDPTQTPASIGQQGAPAADPSDPNGFTTNTPLQSQGDTVIGPDGQSLTLPPNTGAANAYGGQPPQQESQAGAAKDQGDPSAGSPAKAPKGFWGWYRDTYGVKPGDQVDAAHVNKMQEIYAQTTLKAKEVPPPVVKTINGHTYLFAGNNTPINADQKPNPTTMAQLQDGTLGRVDNVTGKFIPVTDAQGNIMRGALKGNEAMMQQLGQMGQMGQPASSQPAPATHWWQAGSKPSPTPTAVPGPTPYNPTPLSQNQAAPPVVAGPDDYAKIPTGSQFVFNGKLLTKRRQ